MFTFPGPGTIPPPLLLLCFSSPLLLSSQPAFETGPNERREPIKLCCLRGSDPSAVMVFLTGWGVKKEEKKPSSAERLQTGRCEYASGLQRAALSQNLPPTLLTSQTGSGSSQLLIAELGLGLELELELELGLGPCQAKHSVRDPPPSRAGLLMLEVAEACWNTQLLELKH